MLGVGPFSEIKVGPYSIDKHSLSRFTSGREAMTLSTTSSAFGIISEFPDIEFGLTTMFTNPQAGVYNATWIGGWSFGLNAKGEHPDEAFQLLRFMTADPDGVAAFASNGKWMTPNFRMPYFRQLGSDPLWQPFTTIVTSTTRYRPAIPALSTYQRLLGEMFPRVIRRQITPSGAMEEVSRIVDAEIAELDAKFR